MHRRLGLERGFECGKNNGHVLGLAARQHGVDGDLLRGQRPLLDRLDAHDVVSRRSGPSEHGLDPLRCGRHDRETVGPAPLAEHLLHGLLVDLDRPGPQQFHTPFLAPRRRQQ
jgi:hypothetical protein